VKPPALLPIRKGPSFAHDARRGPEAVVLASHVGVRNGGTFENTAVVVMTVPERVIQGFYAAVLPFVRVFDTPGTFFGNHTVFLLATMPMLSATAHFSVISAVQ
jgi:hypothetical protein